MIPILKTSTDITYYATSTQAGDNSEFKLIESELGHNKKDSLPVLSNINHLLNSHIVVIDSVNAGKSKSLRGDFYGNIIKPIFDVLNLKELENYTYFETEEKDSIKKFAHDFFLKNGMTDKINNDKKTEKGVNHTSCAKSYTVIVLSGDTSVSEFLNNLKLSYCTESLNILPLPLGTANAWSSILFQEKDLYSDFDILDEQSNVDPFKKLFGIFYNFLYNKLKIEKFPLYKIDFPPNDVVSDSDDEKLTTESKPRSLYMMIIFSMGFHANLLHLTTKNEKYLKMGLERFKLASAVILEQYDLNVHLKLSDKENDIVDDKFAYFALINQSNLEPAYKPSPLSNIFEDKLHLLGYKASLKKEKLIESIMKGYDPSIKNIENFLEITEGVVYEKIESDEFYLNILELPDLDNNENNRNLKFEICIDGYLYDHTDFITKHGSKFSENHHHEYRVKISTNQYPWKNIVKVYTSIEQ